MSEGKIKKTSGSLPLRALPKSLVTIQTGGAGRQIPRDRAVDGTLSNYSLFNFAIV